MATPGMVSALQYPKLQVISTALHPYHWVSTHIYTKTAYFNVNIYAVLSTPHVADFQYP